jgi:hypothetical protein
MARLSTKHANQQTVTYVDFSGGLNLTNEQGSIGERELITAVNVEIDPASGLLKAVCGTRELYANSDITFTDILYDRIGNTILLADKQRRVYKFADSKLTQVGTLTGTVQPSCTPWEDGLLIASGGKLQYWHGGSLSTITASPDANGVYVKTGRVFVFKGDRITFSGVGDETMWTDTSGDDSTSKWVEIGYKDGGQIVGLCNLSTDILVFKDNRRAYRLAGDYPGWTINEVGRNIDCRSFASYCAVADNAVILGKHNMQSLTTTQNYGDVRAADLATKVANFIADLPASTKLRYIPKLNQIWLIGLIGGGKKFLSFDLNCQAFFMREYRSQIVDAVNVGDEVYVLKKHGLYVLDYKHMQDEGEPLAWKFSARSTVAYRDYLVKNAQVDVTPLFDEPEEIKFWVGDLYVDPVLPANATRIYQNHNPIFHNHHRLYQPDKLAIYVNSPPIYGNDDDIYLSDEPVCAVKRCRTDLRCVQRDKNIIIRGAGAGGIFMLDSIRFDISEV